MSVWVPIKTEIHICVCACDLNVGCIAVSGPLQGCASLDTTSTQAAPQPREKEAGGRGWSPKGTKLFRESLCRQRKESRRYVGETTFFLFSQKTKVKDDVEKKKQKTNMRGKEEEEVTGEKSQKTKVKKIRQREEQIKNVVFNFILSAELLVFSSFQSALMFSLV